MLRNELKIALRFTVLTTVILGILYPLAITGIGQVAFPRQANGNLIVANGQIVGSRLIGQSFTGDQYFHGRPSAAGNGYDAASSGPSNYAATSQKLITRIQGDVSHYAAENKTEPVPIDLVTASASGLDPDISPAAALFQAVRVAGSRHLPLTTVLDLVRSHVQGRQFGFLGEERVNVLLLNMDLDRLAPQQAR
ncbi:MAG TPA: potassium-transporting ATPase subunit KdpC [Acidobacteriaceae bacterium]|nr:potassium-transporting ATPase subunit KdpC [Acidobacteriaceae bacterium]